MAKKTIAKTIKVGKSKLTKGFKIEKISCSKSEIKLFKSFKNG